MPRQCRISAESDLWTFNVNDQLQQCMLLLTFLKMLNLMGECFSGPKSLYLTTFLQNDGLFICLKACLTFSLNQASWECLTLLLQQAIHLQFSFGNFTECIVNRAQTGLLIFTTPLFDNWDVFGRNFSSWEITWRWRDLWILPPCNAFSSFSADFT